MNAWTEWLALATSAKVVYRAIRMAIVVGCLLAAINHGDAIARGQITSDRLIKIITTFCVPYLVSTVSSVGAIREANRERGSSTQQKEE